MAKVRNFPQRSTLQTIGSTKREGLDLFHCRRGVDFTLIDSAGTFLLAVIAFSKPYGMIELDMGNTLNC